ncbi:hypothetical protein MTO96_011940 [Rhipicephalus appendiculatus]
MGSAFGETVAAVLRAQRRAFLAKGRHGAPAEMRVTLGRPSLLDRVTGPLGRRAAEAGRGQSVKGPLGASAQTAAAPK